MNLHHKQLSKIHATHIHPPSSSSAGFLTVTDVSAGYDGHNSVLKQISFDLHKGQIGCLLGESGCGKTTMLRTLAGLEPLSAGTISLAGKRIGDADHQLAPAKRGIGMVFQDYALFSHLTVLQNVAFGLHKLSKHKRKKRAMDMLELVELGSLATRRIAQLSGGQQQRVALARALAPEPDLLLLDEPFSNLDTGLRQSLADKVRSILKTANTTAILVTHDQQEAFAMSDVVGVMQAGKLSQWDVPQALYHSPASASVAGFIGEGSLVSGRVESGAVVSALGRHSLACFTVADGAGFSEGQVVQLFVRPEDVILQLPDSVASQKLSASKELSSKESGVVRQEPNKQHLPDATAVAQIKTRTFRGAQFLYGLKLSSDELVLCAAPSQQNFEVGACVRITAALDSAAMFSNLDA